MDELDGARAEARSDEGRARLLAAAVADLADIAQVCIELRVFFGSKFFRFLQLLIL